MIRFAAILWLGLFPVVHLCLAQEEPADSASNPPSLPARPEDPFSAAVYDTILGITNSGEHPEMRWPRFPFYRDELKKIYEPLNYGFFWINENGVRPLAGSVIVELSRSAENGLHPETYDVLKLAWSLEGIRKGEIRDPRSLALFDTTLTMGLLRYISDLHIGRINPKNLHFGLNIEEKKYDLGAVFLEFNDKVNIRDLLIEAQPSIPMYGRLKKLLPRYEELAKAQGLQPVPVMNPVLRPGELYGSLPQLARFLIAVGDLSEADWRREQSLLFQTNIYRGVLVDAVKRFQFRHGLETDGILGPATFEALNVPLAMRVRSIKMALERLRWLPDLHDTPFIVVNIPAFELFAFERNQLDTPALAMNVIVGSAINKTRTPIFTDRMTYLDFSPFWNVPYSIAKNEMLPKIMQDPGYLQRGDLELVAKFGNDVAPLPLTREAVEGISSGNTKIRQRPGPRNALGLVKFIFPNAHNVYLHSTPQQELFSETRRDFSHGCIRVEKPAALAEWVLRNKPDWNPARIERAMSGRQPERVFLKPSLPVFIFYTSVVARQEVVFFYRDIYGHDETLEKALEKGYPYDP